MKLWQLSDLDLARMSASGDEILECAATKEQFRRNGLDLSDLPPVKSGPIHIRKKKLRPLRS